MREPYPNELYHYGVKGMKWGIRKKNDEHPKDSGSLHKGASVFGVRPVGLDSDRTTREYGQVRLIKSIQSDLADFAKASKVFNKLRQRPYDADAYEEAKKALVAMKDSCYSLSFSAERLAGPGYLDGPPITNMHGSSFGYSVVKTLPKLKEVITNNQAFLNSVGKKINRKPQSALHKKKRGRIAAEGILDGQFKNGTGGWNTSIDKAR